MSNGPSSFIAFLRTPRLKLTTKMRIHLSLPWPEFLLDFSLVFEFFPVQVGDKQPLVTLVYQRHSPLISENKPLLLKKMVLK